jgi:hypothetical protein
MKYFIKRGLNDYGPYTLAELQRYVAQGNIAMADLTRSEGMTDWVPVSQVIGDIPVPVTAPVPSPAAGGTVYSGTPNAYGMAAAPAMAAGPVPPDFHWALVLLICIVTCSLFGWAWLIVEAAWVRKIKPQGKGLLFALLALGCYLAATVFNFAWRVTDHFAGNPFAGLLSFASLILVIVSSFFMRSDLEDYYNTTENINLQLNGVGSTLLTLFFPILYLQYHFSRIAHWKKTGVLTPQS